VLRFLIPAYEQNNPTLARAPALHQQSSDELCRKLVLTPQGGRRHE